jgi:hypothetical protein
LRRLDFALLVLRDVHLFFIILALAHQVSQLKDRYGEPERGGVNWSR